MEFNFQLYAEVISLAHINLTPLAFFRLEIDIFNSCLLRTQLKAKHHNQRHLKSLD